MNDKIIETQYSNTNAPLKKKGSAIKAIILALLIDFFGFKVFLTVFGFIVSYILILAGTEPDQIGNKMIDIGTTMQGNDTAKQIDTTIQTDDTSLLNIETLLPFGDLIVYILVCHVLGGYWCARIANHKEYLFTAIVGILTCIFWIVMCIGKYSVDEILIMSASIFIVGLLGAYLHVSSKTNNRIKPTTNNHAV